MRHEVDLYRLDITSTRVFDLAPLAQRTYVYRYAPVFGLLRARMARGRFAPRLLTLFGPLRRLHRRLAGDLRSRKYDVVLAHTDQMTQSPYLLRWLAGTPSVFYCQEALRVMHEPGLVAEHRRSLARSRFPLGAVRVLEDLLVLPRLATADRSNVSAADLVVVNSRYSGEGVKAAYGRESEVCYLGVDAQRFSPGDGTKRRSEVLSIGAPLSMKGHDLVIQALGLISGPARPSLRVVVPSPTDTGSLEELAGRLGVELTIETGLDEAALIERYQRALVTVCAGRREPFGLTALESMACETAAIAVAEGGYRETVQDGRTGLLVDRDAQAMSAAINLVISTPALAKQLGTEGRQDVLRRWTWERSGLQLEAILQRAASGKAGGEAGRAQFLEDHT